MEQLDLFASLGEPDAPKPDTTITLPKPIAGQWASTTAKPRQPAGPPATGTSRRGEFAIRPTDGPAFGEAVSSAWHGAHGGNRTEIPLGIVATLALWPVKGHPRTLADFLKGLDVPQLLTCVREVAAYWWMRRPDLIDTASALFAWAEDEKHSANELRAIRATFHAALNAHALDHTGHANPELNSWIDLMSWTITSLRHHAARQGLGEYHTPPEVCDLMAAQTIGVDREAIHEGYSLCDPAAGTGGMLRSAAQHLRSMDLDPARFTWFAQEIDPLAAAGCAVNFIVWGLGRKALVACGDTLREGDLWPRAVEHRRAMVERRDDVRAWISTAYRLRRVEQLVTGRHRKTPQGQ